MERVEVIAGSLGLATLAAFFVWNDYSQSKTAVPDSIRVRGVVISEDEAYKRLGWGSDYTTPGEGALGKIGSAVGKTINFGNSDRLYMVSLRKLSYNTQGGIFFSSRPVSEDLQEGDTLPIVYSSDIADAGNDVSFDPRSREGLIEILIGKKSKNVIVSRGEDMGVYENPLVNPRDFRVLD